MSAQFKRISILLERIFAGRLLAFLLTVTAGPPGSLLIIFSLPVLTNGSRRLVEPFPVCAQP
ncbi:MAG: hypothetical protein C5B50_17535 [Verrucomicrobia bacterium]|nr:MAG: hypothetical protein C5B50_17535 [Verrucomicrobiota bacterium]